MRFFLSRLLRKAFSIYQCLPSIFSSPAQHMKLHSITQRTAGKEQNLYLSMRACSAHSQTLCNPLSALSLYKPLSSLHQGSFIHTDLCVLAVFAVYPCKGIGETSVIYLLCSVPDGAKSGLQKYRLFADWERPRFCTGTREESPKSTRQLETQEHLNSPRPP